MSVPTAEASAPSFPEERDSGARARPPRLAGGSVYLWMIGASLAVAALSLLLPSTPSYDPWAWLVWGREILHGSLHTPGGPTWKPLPVIFTTVFALFGSAQPNLWLLLARAGAMMATLMTFKLAFRLTAWVSYEAAERVGGERIKLARETLIAWAPALLAGLVAAVGLALSGNLLSDSTLGYSEGLAVAALLVGLERHLDGHYRQAFALGFVAALDRPEIWLFWGPYGLWLMWRDPGSRPLVIGLAVLTLFLWFVPQKWGGGSFTSGVARAQKPRHNSAAYAACPFCTELAKHAWTLVLHRIAIAAALVVACAGWILGRDMRARGSWSFAGRRERGLALLALCGLFGFAWWILVAIETQAGFSGNDRYLVIGSGFIEICGAGGFGWAAIELARWLRRRRTGLPAAGTLGACTALLAAVFVFLPNWVGANTINLSATHRSLVYQATLRKDLATLIDRAGGVKRLEACGAGHVMVEGFQVPMVAWYFDTRTADIEDQPNTTKAGVSLPPGAPWPNVIFQDRDTRHAALLPAPATIIAWEHQGARYFFTRTKEMFFFQDCAPQASDAPQRFQS